MQKYEKTPLIGYKTTDLQYFFSFGNIFPFNFFDL